MNFEITRNNLATAYRILSCALSSGADKNISSYILFRNAGSIVECVTFSGSSHCMTPIDSENLSGPKGEAFCIEGKRLDMFLKASTDKRNIEVHYDAETKVVTLRDSRGVHKFPSEDPRNFSTFDNALASAKSHGQMRADALASTLKFLRPFIDLKRVEKNTHTAEYRDGKFLATDRASLGFVEVSNIPPTAEIRVHGGLMKNLESFLSVWKDQSIEILTTDTATYYRSLDGAVFGEERFPEPFMSFPESALTMSKEYAWTMSKDELVQALNWLRSGSDLEHFKVRLSPSAEGLVLAMRSVTKEMVTCVVPLIEQEGDLENEALTSLVNNGLWITVPVLSRIFEVCDDTVTLNVQSRTVNRKTILALWVQSVSETTGNIYTAFFGQEKE
jgi:hypothetical protein